MRLRPLGAWGGCRAETSDKVRDMPDFFVRIDFSEPWHSCEPDAVLGDPEEFSIGILLDMSCIKGRGRRIHREPRHGWAAAVFTVAHGATHETSSTVFIS